MRAALIQMTGSDTPDDNLSVVSDLFDRALDMGAGFVLTPEVTNCISASRTRQQEVLCRQEDDPVLAALRQRSRTAGVACQARAGPLHLALPVSDPEHACCFPPSWRR